MTMKQSVKSLTITEVNKQLATLQTGEGMINFLEDVLGRKLIKNSADQKKLYKQLGELCEERGWLDGAVTAYKKCGIIEHEVWKRIAAQLDEGGMYDEAAEALIHSGTKKSEAWKKAGDMYEQQTFYAEAAECYKKSGLTELKLKAKELLKKVKKR